MLEHFGEMPLSRINQQEIDAAAIALYPNAGPATRNRQVYTPMRAILRSGGVAIELRRPKGAEGRQLTAWLRQEQAFRLFEAAEQLDSEFGLLCMLLCYTGARLGEILRLKWADVDWKTATETNEFCVTIHIGRTKNGDPRTVPIPPQIAERLRNHPRGVGAQDNRIFRFSKSGHIYSLLRASAVKAEIELPERSAFHIFRHTFATWARRYGGLDTTGLVATGAWKDRKSAARYEHAVVTEEAMKVMRFPVAPTSINSVAARTSRAKSGQRSGENR